MLLSAPPIPHPAPGQVKRKSGCPIQPMKTAYCTGARIRASLLPSAGEVRGSGAAILSPAVHLPPPEPAGSLPPRKHPQADCSRVHDAARGSPFSRCGCEPRSPRSPRSPRPAATPASRRPSPAANAHLRRPRAETAREPSPAAGRARSKKAARKQPRGALRSLGARRAPFSGSPRPYLVAEFEHCHSSVPARARAYIQLSAPQMSTPPGSRGDGRDGRGKRQEPGSRR